MCCSSNGLNSRILAERLRNAAAPMPASADTLTSRSKLMTPRASLKWESAICASLTRTRATNAAKSKAMTR